MGIISDTHGYLDPRVYEWFADCDEVWHAGDWGSVDLVLELRSWKKLRGVYGNVDDWQVRSELPEEEIFEVEGVKVWLRHIAGAPPSYEPDVRARLEEVRPQMLVCGHTHIARVERDPRYGNMLYVNPGAAGNFGPHTVRTILTCEIYNGKVRNMKLIELGPKK